MSLRDLARERAEALERDAPSTEPQRSIDLALAREWGQIARWCERMAQEWPPGEAGNGRRSEKEPAWATLQGDPVG